MENRGKLGEECGRCFVRVLLGTIYGRRQYSPLPNVVPPTPDSRLRTPDPQPRRGLEGGIEEEALKERVPLKGRGQAWKNQCSTGSLPDKLTARTTSPPPPSNPLAALSRGRRKTSRQLGVSTQPFFRNGNRYFTTIT